MAAAIYFERRNAATAIRIGDITVHSIKRSANGRGRVHRQGHDERERRNGSQLKKFAASGCRGACRDKSLTTCGTFFYTPHYSLNNGGVRAKIRSHHNRRPCRLFVLFSDNIAAE